MEDNSEMHADMGKLNNLCSQWPNAPYTFGEIFEAIAYFLKIFDEEMISRIILTSSLQIFC